VLARVKREEHQFGGWLDRLEARSPLDDDYEFLTKVCTQIR
jgi:hypothetical protein